ncbi:MAG: methylenetetrahydrofolate reductase C-terminal domain-containing protein [Chloroflexi bacterium]|nr:methylenetetrahydrofolate reductase C-terminal domain-containing protein [Chloroflexota bacterium]
MIIAERKPLPEIIANVRDVDRLLIVGCNTCVAICLAGGEKEVAVLGSLLRLARNNGEGLKLGQITETCVERQCEEEFNAPLAEAIAAHDVVLSMACGVGVQTLAEQFPDAIVYPALNTISMGRPEEPGTWDERCLGCGNCVLDKFGGVCPITRCSKSLLNGPCGGSANGRCEVDPENLECAWQLIYDRLSRIGQLERLYAVEPAKDWSTSHYGGPRRTTSAKWPSQSAARSAMPSKREDMRR